MSTHKHDNEKIIKEICDYLGGDLDSEMCQEVKDHLDSCPECKVYFDEIKKTVTIYKENCEDLKASEDCKKEIIKSLKLLIPSKK